MPCTLQNGLYFVNIYRNITDINFPPVTYVYTVQMQQKKKKKKRKKKSKSSPWSWDFSQREQGSSQWRASAVQKKVHAGRSPVRMPGTVETTRAKWRSSAGTQFINKGPHTLVLYSQLNSWLGCDLGKIYNAEASMCTLLILFNFVSYTKKEKTNTLDLGPWHDWFALGTV